MATLPGDCYLICAPSRRFLLPIWLWPASLWPPPQASSLSHWVSLPVGTSHTLWDGGHPRLEESKQDSSFLWDYKYNLPNYDPQMGSLSPAVPPAPCLLQQFLSSPSPSLPPLPFRPLCPGTLCPWSRMQGS